jgi:DNA-binding beta-propeller fold protein YncE
VIVADSSGTLYVSDRENNRIQIFDADGKFLRQWTHLGATQGLALTPDGELWAITHRTNIENLTYDTLSGRIVKLDRGTGKILGSIESPGHWIDVTPEKLIFIGSLTGNVFRFRPGWLKHGLGAKEGQPPAR